MSSVPAITALVSVIKLYQFYQIVSGIKEVDPSLIEAAKGIGMNRFNHFTTWKLELPIRNACYNG